MSSIPMSKELEKRLNRDVSYNFLTKDYKGSIYVIDTYSFTCFNNFYETISLCHRGHSCEDGATNIHLDYNGNLLKLQNDDSINDPDYTYAELDKFKELNKVKIIGKRNDNFKEFRDPIIIKYSNIKDFPELERVDITKLYEYSFATFFFNNVEISVWNEKKNNDYWMYYIVSIEGVINNYFLEKGCSLQLGDGGTDAYSINDKHVLIVNNGDCSSVVFIRNTLNIDKN